MLSGMFPGSCDISIDLYYHARWLTRDSGPRLTPHPATENPDPAVPKPPAILSLHQFDPVEQTDGESQQTDISNVIQKR